jgi:hypothetical protein
MVALYAVASLLETVASERDVRSEADQAAGPGARERCSGATCSRSMYEGAPTNSSALEGVRLLWPYGLYHAQLGDPFVTRSAAMASVQAGVGTFQSSFENFETGSVEWLGEQTRRFVVRSAQEPRAQHEACGHSPPRVDSVLPERLDLSEGDDARARFALRRLLEVHVERWAAGTWMHPLLETRGASAGAVKVRLGSSQGYVLRANGHDALWPCSGVSGALVILVLDDGGDQVCRNSSTTWWMSDPRGAGSYSMPPLMQMGTDANVCGRTSEVWVLPAGIPVTFPPHHLTRSRVILRAEVEVQYMYDPELLDFLASEAQPEQQGQVQVGNGERDADGGAVASSMMSSTGLGVADEAASDISGVAHAGHDAEMARGAGPREDGQSDAGRRRRDGVPHFGTMVDGVSAGWRLWTGLGSDRNKGWTRTSSGPPGRAADEETVRRSLASSMLV